METAITISNDVIDSTAISVMPRGAETAFEAVSRQTATYKAINTLIDQTFVDKIDYDYMPGTSDKDIADGKAKKNLLLPGMEKARTLLGLREEYRDIHVIRDFDTPFFYFEVECVLYSIATGIEVGRGQGICHTREKSFMRTGVRVCPVCGKDAIKKSAYAPRGAPAGTKPGWYCHEKVGGCNATFAAEDVSITSQETGSSIDVQLVMDNVNRARKVANKRAFADPIKKVAMMSGRFTTDMEDFDTYTIVEDTPAPKAPPLTIVQKPVEQTAEKKPEAPAPAIEETLPGLPDWLPENNQQYLVNRAINEKMLFPESTWEDFLELGNLKPADCEQYKTVLNLFNHIKECVAKTKAQSATKAAELLGNGNEGDRRIPPKPKTPEPAITEPGAVALVTGQVTPSPLDTSSDPVGDAMSEEEKRQAQRDLQEA